MKKVFIYIFIAFFFLPLTGIIFPVNESFFSTTHTIFGNNVTYASEHFIGGNYNPANWLPETGQVYSAITEGLKSSAVEVADRLLTWIGNIILSLFGAFLWLSGVVLNVTISITVLKMATVTSPDNFPALYDSWEILRDISNLLFIFVLVYAAIATILDLTDTRKIIIRVIIAALFINFSLFFTQIIIDASNIISVRFFDLIGASYADSGSFSINNLDSGISAAFMDNLKLNGIYNIDTGDTLTNAAGDVSALFARVVFGSILIMTAAIIFFAASIMLLVRFLILIFLMILSPVAFVAMILPKTNDQISKKWWASLWDQAIFAPVMMLMFFITLRISSSLDTAFQAGTNLAADPDATVLGSISQAAVSQVPNLLTTLVIFGFLIGSLIIAKKTGGVGADWATKAGGKVVFGGVGWAGRKAGGAVGSRIKDSRFVQRNLNSENRVMRNAARLGLKTGDKIQRGTYDLRNSKALTSTISSIGEGLGGKVDIGKGVSRKDLDKKKKAQEEFAKKNYGVSESYKEKERRNLPGEIEEAENAYINAKSKISQAPYIQKMNMKASGLRSQINSVDNDMKEKNEKLSSRREEVSSLEAQVAKSEEALAKQPNTEKKEIMDKFVEENRQKLAQQKAIVQQEEAALTDLQKQKEALEKELQEKEKERLEKIDQRASKEKERVKKLRTYQSDLEEKGESLSDTKKRLAQERGVSEKDITNKEAQENRKKSLTDKRQAKLVEDVKTGPLYKYSFMVGKTKKSRIDTGAALSKALNTDKDKELLDSLKKWKEEEDNTSNESPSKEEPATDTKENK